MFQNVARPTRQDPQRQLVALLFAVSVPCTLLSLLAYLEPEARRVATVVRDVVEVAIPLHAPAPAPVVAKPARGGGGGGPKTARPMPATPVASAVAPVTLPSESGGSFAATGEGSGEGTATGTVSGAVEGEIGGGSPHRAVHWSEVQVRTRVMPEVPAAMRELSIAEASCVLRLEIDPTGRPETVTFRSCPAWLQKNAQDAAMQWRFYPLVEDGQALGAAFDLRMVFKQH